MAFESFFFCKQEKETQENTFFWKLLKNHSCGKEGTVPVPPHRPCAKSDDNVVIVVAVSHFLEGAEAASVKLLLSLQVLESIFS
ncbi:MAG: hypothetical protein MUO95_08265 [Methanoregula sp.]|nr:hypothetical protein [Methanoregula sp.]